MAPFNENKNKKACSTDVMATVLAPGLQSFLTFYWNQSKLKNVKQAGQSYWKCGLGEAGRAKTHSYRRIGTILAITLSS